MKKLGLWIGLIVGSSLLIPVVFVVPAVMGFDLFQFWWGIALFIILMLLPFVFVAILMISVFGGVFKNLPGLNKEARKLMTQGRPGRATVLSIGETSQGTVTVNQQPYLHLELQIFDGSTTPYQVGIDTIIPRYAVPQFQPGASIPVRIDTIDKTKVVIDWSEPSSRPSSSSPSASSPSSQAEMPTVGNVSDWSTMDDVLLRQDGIDGRARLMGVEPTGKSKGYESLVKMTYEVTAPGMETYSFSKEVPIPSQYIPQLQNCVGRNYPCRIHPKDKTKIKVDITF
ncbi:hypothetical protein GX441_10690 [bacterium]|nr:hypothetical protein [bacterium]